MVLRLRFQGREQVSLESAKVVDSRAHGRLGEPPLLHLRLTDAAGAVIEEFNAWHPLWAFKWDGQGGHERLEVLPEATGRLVMPYHTNMAAVEVSDMALGEPVFSGKVADLALNETRAVNQTFAIQCDTPGAHTFAFTSAVQPLDPATIDLEAANNQTVATVTVNCVVPVAINIKPGSNPNSLNLQGEVGLAVLTTTAGEYGKPLAFDAATIDPLSMRFGPEAPAWSGSGGGTEIHNTGHLEDARELSDEKTRDGDLDMALHFNPVQSGLAVGQAEACVKASGSAAAESGSRSSAATRLASCASRQSSGLG